MKKRTLALIIFLLINSYQYCFSQGIDSKWVMGGGCCLPNFSGIDMDFTPDTLIISTTQRDMIINATNGQICDRFGNLLFYSNGIYVANSLGDTMQNGRDLNPGPFTTSRISYGLTIPQANLVIPFPEDSTKYYLFHETSDDPNNTWATYYLYNSIIDMSLNNGLGAVVQKNTILLHDTLIGGRLTACKHANGRDWWLIVHKMYSGQVFKYLITPQGISGPWIQNLFTWRDTYFGQAVFSPQGNKFAYYEPYGDLDIWNFDRCTGNFSNYKHIDINDTAFAGGAAFSASGRYLYVSSINYIYQFDMDASSIDSSKIVVGVYDDYRSGGLYANFYLSALAPDGKIYTNCGNASLVLHVINNPDSAGLSCDFCQHCIPLPAYNHFTIPNYPNYYLGAEGGSICDSLPTGITTIRNPINEFLLFPNPANRDVYLTLSKDKLQSVSVYNSVGQIVLLEHDVIKNEYLHFDVSKLESGFYYVEVVTAKERVVRKFVRE